MKLLRWVLAILMLLCLAAAGAWWYVDPERRAIDEIARREAPGRFVRLADGVTHYEVAGPDTGRVVLLAAAFSVPAYLSDTLFQRLGREGFRAVRFDYYGRGWSDRPMVTYDLPLFTRQMTGLLDSLHVTGPVDVVGISFGAAIVTELANKSADRVRTLIFINPVFNTGRQLPPRERTALAWSKYMVLGGGLEAMATGQPDDFFYPRRHPDWVARYRTQFQFNGTREALRRTRAAIAVAPHQAEQIRRVGTNPRPVLVVWGRQDGGAPFAESADLMTVLPRGTLVPVDSAGHLPYIDQPDVAVPAIVRFLRSAP
jgi:pimeloyl-ACP methyl ester carboxylesterase